MIAAPGKLDKVEHTYISHDVVFCVLPTLVITLDWIFVPPKK